MIDSKRQPAGNMPYRASLLWLGIGLALLPGCRARPVAGGTSGVLRSGGQNYCEIQVTVHRHDGATWQPIGFGVTAADGSFALVTNGAGGSLWLEPGDYRCTLESVGAPVQISPEYAQAETTPLKITWTGGDQILELTAALQLNP